MPLTHKWLLCCHFLSYHDWERIFLHERYHSGEWSRYLPENQHWLARGRYGLSLQEEELSESSSCLGWHLDQGLICEQMLAGCSRSAAKEARKEQRLSETCCPA